MPATDKTYAIEQRLNSLVTALPALLASATPAAGTALINGTQTFATWTTPNDGNLHRVIIWALLAVTSNETGGQVTATVTPPSGASQNITQFAANKATGVYHGDGSAFGDMWGLMVKANTTVSIQQATALTVGASKIWAEIWGS